MEEKKPVLAQPKSTNRGPALPKLLFLLALLACLSPLVTPPVALLLGLLLANFIGHPFLHLNHRATHILLQASVVGLGFGMNVQSAISAGREGFLFTVISLLSTLVLGSLIGRWMRVDRKTSHLIASGTAICGGSAIAAVAPVIKAEEKQISVALGTIFILNALALFVFPAVGHWLTLSQKQFGLWSAIAIHDTSSVVGAANRYGQEALQIATTVKLARTLWIIPLTFVSAALFKSGSKKIKIPYFIGFFLLAMLLSTYVPGLAVISPWLVGLAKTGLTLTLFLIGAGLNKDTLRTVGLKPLLQAVILWLFISLVALYAVLHLI